MVRCIFEQGCSIKRYAEHGGAAPGVMLDESGLAQGYRWLTVSGEGGGIGVNVGDRGIYRRELFTTEQVTGISNMLVSDASRQT
jgi:hypothetical protein